MSSPETTRRWLIPTLLLLGLPIVGWRSPHTRVALYRSALAVGGKTTRAWVIQHLITEGSIAIPALGLATQDPEPALRSQAAEALEKLGPAALPELLASPEYHPCVRQAAHSILRQGKPAALETALPLLSKGPSALRERILLALAEIYGRGIAAVPLPPEQILHAVGRCLDDSSAEVRLRALGFGADLASIEKRERLWAQHLPAFLDEVRRARSRRLRLAAVRAIGLLGEHGVPALPILEELLEDDDPKARARGIIALRMIGAPARPLLPKIAALLIDPCPSVRLDATHALFFLKAIKRGRYEEMCEHLNKAKAKGGYDPAPEGEAYKAVRLTPDQLEGLFRTEPKLRQILGPALQALLKRPSP